MTDSDAVFSGVRGAQELAGGAIIGGLYGLPALSGNNIINARQVNQGVLAESNAPAATYSSPDKVSTSSVAGNTPQMQTDVQAGQMIKSGGQTTELLQDALQMPADSQAYQLAAELSEQLNTALTELGMDVGEWY